MQFVLTKAPAVLEHVNLGEEKHGDESVLRYDLKIKADLPNSFLSLLDPSLKSSLYRAEGEAPGDQAGLLEDGTHLPVLRYPAMGDLTWEGRMPAASVVLHGARKKDLVELEGDVDKIRLSCKEGGTVEVTFRVQFLPTDEQLGAVPALLQQKKFAVSVAPNESPDTPPTSTE